MEINLSGLRLSGDKDQIISAISCSKNAYAVDFSNVDAETCGTEVCEVLSVLLLKDDLHTVMISPVVMASILLTSDAAGSRQKLGELFKKSRAKVDVSTGPSAVGENRQWKKIPTSAFMEVLEKLG